jgi:SAM-dependent methyltransferase
MTDGYLVVLGEIREPFEESWVKPLGTTTLEGRTLPAPADPDRFLAATYGPGWRVPDPAFVFTTPPSTSKRLDDWFRGIVEQRAEWDGRYQSKLHQTVDVEPDKLAKLVQQREDASAGVVVDIGCGYGHNAYWLAQQGFTVEGLDFSYRAYRNLARDAEAAGLPARYAVMNLLEMRHVLGHGARLAHEPGPHVMLARHIADAMPPRGRANLWRFVSMVGRAGGRLYLDFLTHAHEDDPWVRRMMLRPLDPGSVTRNLHAAGGSVVLQQDVHVGPGGKNSDGPAGERRGCRMVVEWQA